MSKNYPPFRHVFHMQTSDLNVNNTESDHANAIFLQFQDAVFSREHFYVKTLTKIIFDLLQWQEICNAVTAKKGCHRYFHPNNISRAFSPRSQWHYPKWITCHFLQSMRRHFSPVKWHPTNNGLLMRNVVWLFLVANNVLPLRKWNHAFLLLAITLAWRWQLPEDVH